MQGDLHSDADVKALLETTIKCYGKLDILVSKINLIYEKMLVLLQKNWTDLASS